MDFAHAAGHVWQMHAPEMLAAARMGDETAFRRLLEPYRTELQAHCYRMLGSFHDAEDALQETLLRAWRGLARFEGRSSLRSWLYKIATNTCLTMIERRPRRVLPVDYGAPADPHDAPAEPLVESVWVEPYPDETLAVEDGYATPEARYELRESVELAFVAALQHLPPLQRAVLILRDVLGFAPREIADALETSPASVYSALQRAHESVDQRLPEQSQQATLQTLGDERLRRIVERYVEAWENADVEAIRAMLTDGAAISMPPMPTWYRGRDAVAQFLSRRPLAPGRRWRLVAVRANGQPAFGTYGWDPRSGTYVAHALDVLTLSPGGEIREITAYVEPSVLGRFGLPRWIPA
jgi:RNA polymerase sigma-70 factor, ECF subfamily